MLTIRRVVLGGMLLTALTGPALAGSVPVGTVSLAVDFKLGFCSIQIRNLTGDPAAGGYALPPDYPVLTALTWQQTNLTYTTVDQAGNTVSRTVALGTIAPGAFTSSDLAFAQSTVFQSVTLSAVIVPGTFVTSGGTYTSSDLAIAAQLARQDGKPLRTFDSADVLVVHADPATSSHLLQQHRAGPPFALLVNRIWQRRRQIFAL